MGITMIVAWVPVAAVIVWLVRRSGAAVKGLSFTGHHTARDILDERYARGELTDEEYQSRRDLLRTN